MDTYISIDIEADGPIPGPYSMRQLGAVMFDLFGKEISSLSVNLLPLPGAGTHPTTMAFWAKNQAVYDSFDEGAVEPEVAVAHFRSWVGQEKGKPTMVGYPVTYDFMFVYWYLMRFGDHSPFSHSGQDIKTMAADLLGKPYRDITKRNMPKRWFEGAGPHTHKGVDDAREQGRLFFNVKHELWQLHANYADALHRLRGT